MYLQIQSNKQFLGQVKDREDTNEWLYVATQHSQLEPK